MITVGSITLGECQTDGSERDERRNTVERSSDVLSLRVRVRCCSACRVVSCRVMTSVKRSAVDNRQVMMLHGPVQFSHNHSCTSLQIAGRVTLIWYKADYTV